MTTKRIVFEGVDGSVAIIKPDPYARLAFITTFEGGKPVTTAAPLFVLGRKIDIADPGIRWAETETEFMSRVQERNLEVGRQKTREGKEQPAGHYPRDGQATHVIEQRNIPEDLTFRAAWVLAGGAIKIDMPKAREVQKERIRRAREPMLTALDIEFTRAQGKKDQATADAVEAKRQLLRDATDDPAIATAATPEQLKAVWPLPSN